MLLAVLVAAVLRPCHSLNGNSKSKLVREESLPAEPAWEIATEVVQKEAVTHLKHSVSGADKQGRSSALCSYLEQTLKLREGKGLAKLLSKTGQRSTVNQWPKDCQLPVFLQLSKPGMVVDNHIVLIKKLSDVESTWAAIPPGAMVVVALTVGRPLVADESTRSSVESFIWQAMYNVHSYEYFESFTGLRKDDLGFPGLKNVVLLPGHAVLKKAYHSADVESTYAGRFYNLAKAAGTDKIDGKHNYMYLYHTYLDTMPRLQRGVLLEIGLGCTMTYGAGASAGIWPKLLPHDMSTQFLELNHDCVKKWKPQMVKAGIESVYEGSQADPVILEEITRKTQQAPGGLQIVIDDGSHECHHIEQSFRLLFPEVASKGMFFVEDMMYSSWGTKYRQNITSKDHPTEGTPIALAAVLGAAASGVAQDNFPASTWADGILDAYGALVQFVECTPGICMFKRS